MNFDIDQILQLTQGQLTLRHDTTLEKATAWQLHDCLVRVIMTASTEAWAESKKCREQLRHAYYFSAEYLVGRLIYSNLDSLGILQPLKKALAEKGVDIAILEDIEDAALGNGGLGRLAACYLDSAATCKLPVTGYGLRYRFGLFKQDFENDAQKELADDWTKYGDPWSYRRYNRTVKVKFPDHTVNCVPYDMPVFGYRNGNIGTLRLWQCEAENELNFAAFNAQDYQRAIFEKNQAEDITRVLYPNDSNYEGKRLRIKQQYVICSASLQDILYTYETVHGPDWASLPEYCAVQLNDTHPAMSIPELVRLLGLRGIDFDEAFAIAQKVFSYTNHTIMAEALEKWNMDLLRSVVPDICDILVRIDAKLRQEHGELFIIRDNTAHMANLSVYGGSKVNGVARIHSEIIRDRVFADFSRAYPEKFTNVTNGITPRRWLALCNPELCSLLHDTIGDGFITNLDMLHGLKNKMTPETVARFNAIKLEKKKQLCAEILKREGIEISPDFVFDVQVKRLHEYKRQLLNALAIMDIYKSLKSGELQNFRPTVFLFGAKAAPGYERAKSIIRYINRISKLINNDPDVSDKMKVVFVRNYNCSWAEKIIPAADISEQISPAGTEASGTGNMKLMLNGAVTLGTLDGANIEIVEQAGRENNYIFGATVEELGRIANGYVPSGIYNSDYRVKRALDTLVDGTVESDDGLRELHSSILNGTSWHRADHYYIIYEFRSYVETKLKAISDYGDRESFGRKCLSNVAAAGKFSSDRAIREYAENIWHLS